MTGGKNNNNNNLKFSEIKQIFITKVLLLYHISRDLLKNMASHNTATEVIIDILKKGDNNKKLPPESAAPLVFMEL